MTGCEVNRGKLHRSAFPQRNVDPIGQGPMRGGAPPWALWGPKGPKRARGAPPEAWGHPQRHGEPPRSPPDNFGKTYFLAPAHSWLGLLPRALKSYILCKKSYIKEVL